MYSGERRGRGRSGSPPPDRFRRSPPPKRFRRDDDYDGGYDRYPGSGDRGGPRGGYRGRGGYGGRGGGRGYGRPPYDDRYDDRGPPPRRRDGPMTYREFMQDLPNDITPEAANEEYRAYLAGWWGDAIKAEFEARKHDPALRRRFDPREIAKVAEQRGEAARAAAQAFADDLAAGVAVEGADDTPPGPAAFGTAMEADGAGAAQEGAGTPPPAPPLVWGAAQVAADLALAKELTATVDREKGISSTPLLPGAGAAGGGEQEEGGEGEAPAEQQAQEMDAELSYEEQLAKLDQLLAYLWRVHGIDYYGGREYFDPEEPGRAAARRTRRGEGPAQAAQAAAAAVEVGEVGEEGQQQEKPAGGAAEGGEEGAVGGEGAGEQAAKEGEGGEEAKAAADGAVAPAAEATAAAKPPSPEQAAAKEYDHRVTGFWRYRIEHGDALEAPLQRKRVEEGIEAFVEDQIVKHDDKKWGNKLSTKLFMGKEFVVKHIRNKHAHRVEEERDRLQDQVYWENFRAFKQEEQRRQQEEQERVMAGWGASAEALLPGAAGRGGGGRGARGGGGFGGPMLEGGMLLADPAMVMGAPVFVPGAAAPIIMPMDMVMPLGVPSAGMGGGPGRGMLLGGRGGRGGRGGGRGMVGGPGAKLDAGGGVRQYYDLDAPANNRGVLDYSDL
eukprot:scaffold14.g1351.t1